MQLSDLLSVDTIACDIEAGSKKRVLEQIGGMIADSQPSLSQNQVFESLIGRERLGSTGLGHGVAIPHGRLKNSDITTAAFVKLKQPIDYDSSDGKPVDLLCALLVPEESTQEHLNLLSSLARMFSDEQLVEALRQADTPEGIHRLIGDWFANH